MRRLLSVSESSTLLDCSWRWDLAYGGHLAGSALTPRDTPLLLREGRAWGRAMAVLHTEWNRTDRLTAAALAAIESLAADEAQRQAAGLADSQAFVQAENHQLAVLHHYDALAEPLPLYGAETRLEMALPAAQRHSNRYRLEAYLDGLHDDQHGTWVVEFKWRASRIQDFELAARQRQMRWYGWSWREHLGRDICGVILDERLGIAPEPVRLNQDGRPSKVQSCTPEAYAAAGGTDPEVAQRLQAKVWQARRRITFRPHELDQAGIELRSMARLIAQHDSGQLAPVRNPSQYQCGRCRFRSICDQPEDEELVSALYERVLPKRLRERQQEVVA
jgi:hypothetical protein